MDQLDFMLRDRAEIDAFEQKDAQSRPWAYPR
jgi:hypothetical protein